MKWILAAALAAITGCLHDPAVRCDDGRICPPGNLCDDVHALCVLPEQATACTDQDIPQGEVCTAAGAPGICDSGYCVPGCGDGVHAANEECDDGNFASHDGCSSQCLIESPVWTEWHSQWPARQSSAAAYATFDGVSRLLLLGGLNEQGFLGDAWERGAGRAWSQVAAAAGAPRASAAVAYDSDRHVVVLFGGTDGAVRGDTLEYDGHTWTERHPAASPPARLEGAMIYDPVRHRIVMFGGAGQAATFGDTWEYDGTTWMQVTSVTSPPLRFGAGFVWDSTDQVGILFGGIGASIYGDTWAYQNGTWTEITGSQSPPARFWAALADLPSKGSVVLFGGAVNGFQAASDTWEYATATGWTPVTGAPVNPPARGVATFVYDPTVSAAVLVGGSTRLGADAIDDVWEYGTSGWVDRTPQFSPSPRSTAIAYDEARRQSVLFGDFTPLVGPAQTWTFDGARWLDVTPQVSSIGPRFEHSLVYDAKHQRVVTFGTTLFGDDRETWFWDGMAWTNHTRPDQPPGRARPGLAYDAARGVTVMFGGYSLNAGRALADTWELDDEAWTQVTTDMEPPAQITPAIAYDVVGRRTILFGEDGTTWAYDAHVWRILWPRTDATPAARTGCALLFDPQRQRIVLYGGEHITTHEALTDLWELDDDGWHSIDQQGRPPRRRIVHMARNPPGRGLILYGGTGGGGTGGASLGDTWLFAYRSNTPDEDCTNQADEDGDRHVDGDDPDCR